MTDIYTNIDDLIALTGRKVELLHELKRALRLADLVGIPPKEIKGKLSVKIHNNAGAFDRTPWSKATMSVRIGDGPWEDFKLTDVHLDIWPDDMRRAYNRSKKNVQ